VLDLLLPPRCGGCRALGAWLCASCRARVRAPEEPLCARCGRELEQLSADCGCRSRLPSLARIRSAAAYEGPLERALHRFKYEGWRSLAPALAGLVTARLPPSAGQPPPAGQRSGQRSEAWLVAVPLHRRRQRERGYNQSALLAREIRRAWALDLAPGRLLRVRDTPPQVGLDRQRRRENVAGAFRWRGAPLAGAFVLLVDDVATTGATLEACARALRDAGAGRIEAITVARVSS
jgi:ComF family protein